MGGDSKSVRVLLDDGKVSEVPLEEAAAVEFSARKPAPPPPPPAPKPAAAPAPAPAPKAVMVPAGTMTLACDWMSMRLPRSSTRPGL